MDNMVRSGTTIQRVKIEPAVRCIAGFRHLFEGGATFQESVNGVTTWVARLVCTRCDSVRVTLYEPHSGWVQIGAHRYLHPEDYRALLDNVDPAEANREILNSMWVG